MSRDLLQAATDFCKNIGLFVIYSETACDGQMRYLLWRPPEGGFFEVRSGRTEARFRELDQRNVERRRTLLSLHINENDIYSGVWISPEHHGTAVAILAVYGIGPAERRISG
jgi:hypothetical protein